MSKFVVLLGAIALMAGCVKQHVTYDETSWTSHFPDISVVLKDGVKFLEKDKAYSRQLNMGTRSSEMDRWTYKGSRGDYVIISQFTGDSSGSWTNNGKPSRHAKRVNIGKYGAWSWVVPYDPDNPDYMTKRYLITKENKRIGLIWAHRKWGAFKYVCDGQTGDTYSKDCLDAIEEFEKLSPPFVITGRNSQIVYDESFWQSEFPSVRIEMMKGSTTIPLTEFWTRWVNPFGQGIPTKHWMYESRGGNYTFITLNKVPREGARSSLEKPTADAEELAVGNYSAWTWVTPNDEKLRNYLLRHYEITEGQNQLLIVWATPKTSSSHVFSDVCAEKVDGQYSGECLEQLEDLNLENQPFTLSAGTLVSGE